MEKMVFETVIRRDNKLWSNDYVLGAIRGICLITCELEYGKEFAMYENHNGCWVYPIECTAEQYMIFRKTVEKFYPGLCLFAKIED